ARTGGHDFESDPLVAVLGTAGDTPRDQLLAGLAMQDLLLTAVEAGLAASLLSQPIEVPAAREQLRLGLGRYGPPQIVARIGYGTPGTPSPRRPAVEVIDAT
ncbi:MAG TPA: nitroreductase, partial [Rugosimonospora sp.]|nr:nitroreductase [Rugosimonospora sp.]